MLLAIDPGVNSPGAALFYPGQSDLRAAARLKAPGDYKDFEPGQRWLQVAKLIVSWAAAQAGLAPINVVVFECPQWYQRGKSKSDPNQLVGIAGVAANVTGIIRPPFVRSPTPAEWIGQLPKVCPACGANKKKCPECSGMAWNTPRGRRIRSRLSAEEIKLVPDQNDAIDAVGLGLWALGRLAPRSVFSNGQDGR